MNIIINIKNIIINIINGLGPDRHQAFFIYNMCTDMFMV